MNHSRRGIALLEAIVAAALLAVLFTVSFRMMASISIAHRSMERRGVALQEAANALEQATALPWDQITSERLDELGFASSLKEALPNGTLAWAVETDTPFAGKQVRVEITWPNQAGGTDAPVRLTTWVYPSPGASP